MRNSHPVLYDRWMILSLVGLLSLGLIMVASASIVISEKQFGHSFHFLIRQATYLGLAIVLCIPVLKMSSSYWKHYGGTLLIVAVVLLALVLVPGVGREVNGSMRWIGFGPFGMQISELAKFCVILFLASYLTRHSDEVQNNIMGFVKPMLLLGVIAILLLKEPDFGATVVILATALGMMFIAKVKLRHFALLVTLVLIVLVVLAISSPYRLERLTTFMNPWAHQFNSGYQLTQSLIAFGRGGWFGVGLGDSVQKLFYLPEAHTDFLFAVLAEELGLLGITIVMALYLLLVARILKVHRRAMQLNRPFEAYTCLGFGLWMAFQAMINMGVNAGVLPTKGLTLPLMSYGGSSLLINCIALAIVLRIDYETRCELYGVSHE